jgi:hypothetical protein
MNNKFFLSATFLLLISLPVSNSFSQQLYKSFEDIGGGSGSSNTSVDSNDDYILYIVGGAVIAGIVVYTLLKDKKEKPKEDTTAVILNEKFLAENFSFDDKVSKLQSQIPINISFGFQRDLIMKEDKRYFVGLNYKF